MCLLLTLNVLANAAQNVGLATGQCKFRNIGFFDEKSFPVASFYYPGKLPKVNFIHQINLPPHVTPECYASLYLACHELAYAYHEIGSKGDFPYWLEEYIYVKNYPPIRSFDDLDRIINILTVSLDPEHVFCSKFLPEDQKTFEEHRPIPHSIFPDRILNPPPEDMLLNFKRSNPLYRGPALKIQPTDKNWDVVMGALKKNPSLLRDVFFNVLKRHGVQALKTLKDIIITGGKIGTAAVKIGAAFTVGFFDTVLSILFNAGALDVDGQGGLKSGYTASTLETPLLDDEFEALVDKEFLSVSATAQPSTAPSSSSK